MALFEWTKNYTVGIDSIDAEHQKLYEIINRVYEKIDKKEVIVDAETLLNEVVDYVTGHFQNEEKLMKETGYTLSAAHKEEVAKHFKEHADLREKVEQYQLRLKNDGYLSALEFLGFLIHWFKGHMAHTDMKFGTFINR